ncbi:uncharacterized protein LOC127791524 [Diospyros lotus]|uniref:uncharacterized protein LOC127791524 n=1 Tax=Diospyros lotus TaxID=55363 RepID=UPI0022514A00|nr:uncharacterized protein LOC127791524 [Diospyros lotus]
MAKNRNKNNKKKSCSTAMDIPSDHTVADVPQAMDTSESAAPDLSPGASNRKTRKGVQMKRSKNVRKIKAIAKAVSQNEKILEKILKNENKTSKMNSAKRLYD